MDPTRTNALCKKLNFKVTTFTLKAMLPVQSVFGLYARDGGTGRNGGYFFK